MGSSFFSFCSSLPQKEKNNFQSAVMAATSFTHPKTSSSSFSTPTKSRPNVTLNPIVSFSPNPSSLLQTLKLSSSTTSTATNFTPLGSSTSTISDNISVYPQSLKARLRDGETLYGLFLLSFSPTLAEIAGLSGYDFVVVDMEHGYGGITEALPCLRALAATQTPAILRLPENCPTWAKKALDIGPQGIIFPLIETAKSAKKAVSYCRFPPTGVRGSAHTFVRASKYGIDAGYLSNYQDDLLIICQVESEEGVKKIEEIAAVDGVDCIHMGPMDLSASMGYLWDPGNKKVKEMMKLAEKGVLSSKPNKGGAFLAGVAMPHDGPSDLRSRGYHMVSGALDTALFKNAAVEDVRKFKMGLINGSDDEREHGTKDGDDKYWSE